MNGYSSHRIVLAAAFFVGSVFCDGRAQPVPTHREPAVRHNLHYEQPALVWDEAFPLGNGLLGALVWGDGRPVRISLDRTDLWDLRPVPEFGSQNYSYETMRQWVSQKRLNDLHRLYDAPYHNPGPTKIPAGRIEVSIGDEISFDGATLSLAEAVATLQFKNGGKVRVFVHACRPVGFILVDCPGRATFTLLPPPFASEATQDPNADRIVQGQELSSLGYKVPVEVKGNDWAGFLQEGWGGFKFAVAVVWRQSEGASLAVWSIATSNQSSDPLKAAIACCREAIEMSPAQALSGHGGWWEQFWSKSAVSLPNEIVERQWYLETYKFGSAARADTPPITLQGPWTADNRKIPPWKGDYHHDLNTELSYWPCYSGNHLDGGLGFVNWLWNTKDSARAWTKRFFNKPGLNVPMTADLNQNQIGGWHQYTHSCTTAAWLAHHFYLQWRYSMDKDFLQQQAYPFLKEVAVFLEAVTEKGPDGKRTLPLSSSPEINDDRLEAWFSSITNYDLALIRWTFATAAELAEELGQTRDAQHWRGVLAETPDFALDPQDRRLLVAKDYPLKFSHRHFSHLMAIHPLGIIRWENGPQDQQIIKASLAELERLGSKWWTGYSFSWLASFYARARDGTKAENALQIFSTAFCLRNSFHCNGDQSGKGYSNFRYRPFTLEGNFAAAAAIQEMLLQSYSGAIRIFPAVPESWKDVSFKTLRAEGAFLVSAERKDGVTSRVEIISEKGGLCRLENPFGSCQFHTEGLSPEAMQRADNELHIKTSPGQRITLTRSSSSHPTGDLTQKSQ
jgi:alpha-L-fucosidase 2